MQKQLWALFLAVMIMIGACGCMKANDNYGRKENDQEYSELMLKYMEEKYNTTFQIVEYIFPKAGINSGMKENVVVVEDPSGVTANVKARLGAPYSYYDDYVNACGADQIQHSLDLSQLQKLGNARLYAVVNSKNMTDINITPEGVASITLVVNIPQQPTEHTMELLYDVYCQICNAGHQNIYLIAWFTDGSAEFDRAVDNYRIYGKSNWQDYSGTVYAALKITTPGLSYQDFCAALTEH